MTGIKLLRLEKVVGQAAAMVLPGRKTKSRVSENLVKKESVRTAVSNEFCVTSHGQPPFPIVYTNVNNRQWRSRVPGSWLGSEVVLARRDWTKTGPDCYELSGGLDDSRRTCSSCSIV